MSAVKKCGSCREIKDTSEFVERRDAPGKFMPRCKACRGLEQSDKRTVKQSVKPEVTEYALKKCTRCGEEKATDEFHRNRLKKDGLSGYCKQCRIDWSKNRRSDGWEATPRTKHIRTTRTLGKGEPDPSGEPSRYENAEGYIRLRWKVEGGYVERYERDPSGTLVRNTESLQRVVDAEEAARLYESGLTQIQVGEAMGFNSGTISRALSKKNIVIREPAGIAIDVDEVLRRYGSGEGYVVIGRSLGVRAERVKEILIESGMEFRGAGRVMGVKTGPKQGPVSYETEFKRMRPLIHERSNGRCEALLSPNCRRTGVHVHHRKLRSQGGQNDLATLVNTCLNCHMFIHAHPEESYSRGFLVHGWDNPWTTPMDGEFLWEPEIPLQPNG